MAYKGSWIEMKMLKRILLILMVIGVWVSPLCAEAQTANKGTYQNYRSANSSMTARTLRGGSIMDERDVYRAKEAIQFAMKKGSMRVALIIVAGLVSFLFLNP